MIHAKGRFLPSKGQKAIVHAVADDSFTASLPDLFFGNAPSLGWKPVPESGVALRMRTVEPHTDTWVGRGNEPRKRAALFWVVDSRSGNFVAVQVGAKYEKLYSGDFIIFDDRILHCVVSERLWYGAAYQLRG